tara:strand:+ start:24211 stop:24933 length:723 start_codon:yes stop_codon:yes gene_type:complete
MDRIDAYKEVGAEVIDVYDEFANEFFVINDRICLYRRSKEWGDRYANHEWEDIVHKQVKVKYQAMVFFNKGQSLEDLDKTLKSLSSQDNPPSIVTVASTNTDIITTDTVRFMENEIEYKKFKWKVQSFLKKDIHPREAADLIIDQTKQQKFLYYITFEAGKEVPSEFSSELQTSLQTEMKRVGTAVAKEYTHGTIASILLHKKHAGNSFHVRLEDKIKEFEENGNNYIFKTEDICPSLVQ